MIDFRDCTRFLSPVLLSASLLLSIVSCSDMEEESSGRVQDSGAVEPGADAAASRAGREIPGEEDSPRATNSEEYTEAADLVREHYTAISRGSYRRAFDLWDKGSRDFEEFSREAEQISRAVVTFGDAGRAGTVEGMPTIEVPVTVQITTPEGRTEERHESFLLRKSPEEGWRLLQRMDL